jgi:glycosyltransferase involved in cell wall biosynthesis
MPDEVGGGFKLKLLDYVFGGLPIATIGSQFNDLPLDMDRDAIARENVADLVAAIVEAMDDIPRLEAMRRRALAACEGRFDWAERGARLAEAIAAISPAGDAERAVAA